MHPALSLLCSIEPQGSALCVAPRSTSYPLTFRRAKNTCRLCVMNRHRGAVERVWHLGGSHTVLGLHGERQRIRTTCDFLGHALWHYDGTRRKHRIVSDAHGHVRCGRFVSLPQIDSHVPRLCVKTKVTSTVLHGSLAHIHAIFTIWLFAATLVHIHVTFFSRLFAVISPSTLQSV